MHESSSRLRYVDASQLDSRVLDLDGLDVRNHNDDHIGDVEGLLVDGTSGRPRYLVIDSGGWFRSRRFLLPVMHARVDSTRKALRVDLDKDTVNRFPEMRDDRFDAVSDDDWQRYDDGVLRAYGRDTAVGRDDRYDRDRATSPSWWNAQAWTTAVPGAAMASSVRADSDVVSRAERETVIARDTEPARDGRLDLEDRHAPAVGERAQPGDILGIESAGETTNLGDTTRDEDKRREQAEEAIRQERIEPEDKRRK
jgi:hypothetical protein